VDTHDPNELTGREIAELLAPVSADPPLTNRDQASLDAMRSAIEQMAGRQKATLFAVIAQIANTRAQRGLDVIRDQITENTRGLPEDKSVLDVDCVETTIQSINDEYADAIDEAFGSRTRMFGDW